MAKTTTTTKAKTNTTKKKPATKKVSKAPVKAVKATKAASAKAPVKASKAVKKPATKTAKPSVTVRKEVTLTSVLKRPFVLAGFVYAALAVLAGFFVNTTAAQVFVGYLAKDDLASRAGTVLAPAAYPLYEVQYKWLLVTLLGVAAVIAILRGTRYYSKEQAGLKRRVQPLRWVEFAVTGAIGFGIVGLLSGVQDVIALKASMVFIAFAALFAWLYERENAATGKPSRALYAASAVSVALPVIFLVATLYSSYIYGMARSPWYTYAAAAVLSLGLLLTIRTVRTISGDYAPVERRYNVLSVGTKVLLATILIVGLYAN